MRVKCHICTPLYHRETVCSHIQRDYQCPCDVLNQLIKLPPIILVWRIYYRGEKSHFGLQIPTYSSTRKKNMWHNVMELCNLSSDRGLLYFLYQTLNTLSFSGVGAVMVIYSGNSSDNVFIYGIIDTSTFPLVEYSSLIPK